MAPIKSRFKKGTKHQQVLRTLSDTAPSTGVLPEAPSLPNSPIPAALPGWKGKKTPRKQTGKKSIKILNLGIDPKETMRRNVYQDFKFRGEKKKKTKREKVYQDFQFRKKPHGNKLGKSLSRLSI